MSMDGWRKKLWYIYIYRMEYYSTLKKILPFAAVWMNLEDSVLSVVSQTEGKRNPA